MVNKSYSTDLETANASIVWRSNSIASSTETLETATAPTSKSVAKLAQPLKTVILQRSSANQKTKTKQTGSGTST
jgi:hypothetical protein